MSDFLNSQEIEYFQKKLSSYSMSVESMKAFVDSNFAVIAGPAGAGKDTLRNLLAKSQPDKYQPILSTTTRQPRTGEKDGEDYHFRSIEYIKNGVESGEFFQAALVHNQQVSCLDISEINKLTSGQIGISILIVQAEEALAKIKSDIMTVFVVPPTLDELMKRLNSNRKLGEDELDRRLEAAQKELTHALKQERYQCFVNDNLETAAQDLDNFFQTRNKDNKRDDESRMTIQKVLNELMEYNRHI